MKFLYAFAAMCLGFLPRACDAAQAPQVLVSIRPLYGIAASIMKDVGTPQLLLEGSASPHTYHLKPGDVREIEKTDLLFWIGPAYEGFLTKVVQSLPEKRQLQCQALKGMTIHTMRSGGLWEQEEHHHHGEEHGHHGDHQHVSGSTDGHIWLDVSNVQAMAQALADHLIQLDPVHKKQYETNLNNFLQQMDTLQKQLKIEAEAIKNEPIIVFHDAYQYLEKSLNLKVVGSILLEPEMPAGACHLKRLHALVEQGGCRCIFSEPQFSPALVNSLSEKSNIPVALLDPLGTQIPLSDGHYEQTLTQILRAIHGCTHP